MVNRSEDSIYAVAVLPFDAAVIQLGDMRPGVEEIRLLPPSHRRGCAGSSS